MTLEVTCNTPRIDKYIKILEIAEFFKLLEFNNVYWLKYLALGDQEKKNPRGTPVVLSLLNGCKYSKLLTKLNENYNTLEKMQIYANQMRLN